jgi:hypothetical protein
VPRRRRVNLEHVVDVHGTGLTPTERTAKIEEINKESLAAAEWVPLFPRKIAGETKDDVCNDQGRAQSWEQACEVVL